MAAKLAHARSGLARTCWSPPVRPGLLSKDPVLFVAPFPGWGRRPLGSLWRGKDPGLFHSGVVRERRSGAGPGKSLRSSHYIAGPAVLFHEAGKNVSKACSPVSQLLISTDARF